MFGGVGRGEGRRDRRGGTVSAQLQLLAWAYPSLTRLRYVSANETVDDVSCQVGRMIGS